MMQDTQNQATMINASAGEGAIRMRLDTSRILTEMELFLKGKRIIPTTDKDGMPIMVIEDVGHPLMNEDGIQALLLTLSLTASSHGVQGNWKSDYFDQYINEIDDNLTTDMFVNRIEWGVKLEHYNVICNAFINLLQQFASRIIDNKERESYGLSMRTMESVVQNKQPRSSLFGV